MKIEIKKKNRTIYQGYKPAFKLTRRQAKHIKFLRVERGYTWRAVARDVHDKYPELNVSRGHQIDGADLCDSAMILLKEPIKSGWN